MELINRLNIEKLIQQDKNAEALRKYAKVGKLFASDESKSDEYYALALADTLEELVSELHIP